MNYLELCNEVLVRMREDEITDIADVDNEPQQKLVTRFVQDAYDFVLKAHNWNSQRKEWKIPIIEGQNIYELPVSSEGASVYSVELKDDCNKKNDMIEVDAPGLARLDECQTGVPYYYAPSRVVNGKLGLEIWPMPVIPKEPEDGGGDNPGGGGEGCPCSCGEFTFDPLACEPGVITGGLYQDFPFPDAEGIYPNYDGSKGRTSFWQLGEPRTETLGANIMGDFQVLPNSGVFYKGWSYRSSAYDSYLYAHVDPDNSVEGRPGPTKANQFEEVYEFACLLGYVDNYASADRGLVVPGIPSSGRNAKVNFSMRGKLENDAHDLGIEACAFSVEMSREGNAIKYNATTSFGGGETRTAYIPERVMDPEDKTCWLSAKVTVNIDSEGVAKDFSYNGQSIGLSQTTLWVYSMDARADLYCNGVLFAEDVRVRSKSGYFPDARRTYTTAPCAAYTEPTEYYFRGHQNPPTYTSNDPYPSVTTQFPSSGNQRSVALFLDMGPGAADIANTELGKNLQRVDPNHKPSDLCDCPELPKPEGVDRMAILSSETPNGQYATVDGFLTNESGGASTMPYGRYQSEYDTVRLGSTNGDVIGEIYLPYKGFRNHPYWSSANGQTISFTPEAGPGELYDVLSSDDYPEDNARGTPSLSVDWEIAIYLDWGMHAGPIATDYVRLSPAGDINCWHNSTTQSYTCSLRFSSGKLNLNGDGEVTWQKGLYATSPSQTSIQLADREQMTGWYIIRCKQDIQWVNDGTIYSEWQGTAEHQIETPWGYTFTETFNQAPYGAGSGVSKYLESDPTTGLGQGADLYTLGTTGWKVPIGAAIYADKRKGETIPRDVLTWYEQQRADYVAPPAPTATPLTGQEAPDFPIGDPIVPTGDELVVNGYGMAPKLVANEDICEIPEQVVLYYALSLASRERGEVGGMAAAEIFALSKQYLADAIARDIGNSRHEYTWETV